MEKKEKPVFSKGFFNKPRPTISSKEALKDVIPIKWDQQQKRKKMSLKEKKVL